MTVVVVFQVLLQLVVEPLCCPARVDLSLDCVRPLVQEVHGIRVRVQLDEVRWAVLSVHSADAR